VQDHVDPVSSLVKTKEEKRGPHNFTIVKTGWVGRLEKWLPRFVVCNALDEIRQNSAYRSATFCFWIADKP
jgi:hypothetical protein